MTTKHTPGPLSDKQEAALLRVATTCRVNLHELGRTGTSLLRRGLLRKDWHRTDMCGEAIAVTEKGKEELKGIAL